MFYRYNSEKLHFEPVKRRNYWWLLLGLVVLVPLLSGTEDPLVYEKILNVSIHRVPLTEKNVILKIKDMNMKFPHIVMAQALLESHQFRSDICKENYNLFGMKQARQRITTARGTRRNHAYYDNWEDSLMDYALWYAYYGKHCKTEQEFYNVLSGYAEAAHYEEALRNIIVKNKLREKFSDA